MILAKPHTDGAPATLVLNWPIWGRFSNEDVPTTTQVALATHAQWGRVRVSVVHWAADADGDCELLLDPGEICGRVYRVVTAPTGTAPSDNYDITLLTAYGVDLLQGMGANRDEANVEQVWIHENITTGDDPIDAVAPVTHCCHRFVVANAGDGGGGTCAIWQYV